MSGAWVSSARLRRARFVVAAVLLGAAAAACGGDTGGSGEASSAEVFESDQAMLDALFDAARDAGYDEAFGVEWDKDGQTGYVEVAQTPDGEGEDGYGFGSGSTVEFGFTPDGSVEERTVENRALDANDIIVFDDVDTAAVEEAMAMTREEGEAWVSGAVEGSAFLTSDELLVGGAGLSVYTSFLDPASGQQDDEGTLDDNGDPYCTYVERNLALTIPGLSAAADEVDDSRSTLLSCDPGSLE